MYYPKSQIKTNLYTNGRDYTVSSTQQEYIGPYYEISTGKKYTGRFPGDGENLELEDIIFTINESENSFKGFQQQTIIEFSDDSLPPSLNTNNSVPRFIPSFNAPRPTQQEIERGRFTRYFCKKTNEIKYIEINKDTFNKLSQKDPQIAWDLYQPVSLFWYMGIPGSVATLNENAALNIEKRLRWVGFVKYFKGKFTQYSS
jgi:hypothetical protein